jgi:hypothetical protein
MTSKINRRMFIRGTGGALLAIPFLPSLTTRAFAQPAEPGPVGRCFMAICTDHGDIWGANQYPQDAILTEQLAYAGRTVRYGSLPNVVDGQGNIAWSPAYTAAAGRLTPQLVSKFNILRGLDIPYRIGHHVGGHLGNFAATATGTTDGISNAKYATATVDQVMAYSPNFYLPADLDLRMTQRSFCIGSGRHSHNFSSPSTRTGAVVNQPAQTNNHALYDYLFQPGSSFNGINSSIVGRIRDNFARLRRHPRLSRGDQMRLDQHVERMAEIERKLRVIGQLEAPPPPPDANTDTQRNSHAYWHSPELNRIYCGLINDMIVVAFSSGTSRVGTWAQNDKFTSSQIADWHGNVAHSGMGAEVAQGHSLRWNQGTFEHVMVDLAAKLDDVITHDGQTLLDHSLITLTSEAGQYTHHTGCVNYPLVTAGRAGGFFNTGYFVDYTDKRIVYDDLDERIQGNGAYQAESPGLYYNQWLANAVQSMGLERPEYETFREFTALGPARSDPVLGYGFHFIDPHRAADYAGAKMVIGDRLPIITT